jgi:hypothetical protein
MSDDECPTLLDLFNQHSNSNDHVEFHFYGVFNIIITIGSYLNLLLSYNLDAYSRPYVHPRTLRYLGNLIHLEGENGVICLTCGIR